MSKGLKGVIKSAANQFGFEISKVQKNPSTGLDYEPVRTYATYSPWNTDSAFTVVLATVDGFTLVDKYRCFELWKLVEQVSKLKGGALIEVGVWRGGTGTIIATQAKNCGIKDKVFLCDTFTGVVKAGKEDSLYVNGEHADTSLQTVKDLVHTRMKLDNVELLQGIFPDQTGHRVEGLQFRFCHIDVDVYQSAKDVVEWIWDKMVPGGIIVYDDYGFYGCDGITKYVNEQMLAKDRLVFHNINGHAVIVKL